jgi:hypothetical protein
MKMKKMAVSRKYFQGRHFSFLELVPFAKEPGGYFKAEGVESGAICSQITFSVWKSKIELKATDFYGWDLEWGTPHS